MLNGNLTQVRTAVILRVHMVKPCASCGEYRATSQHYIGVSSWVEDASVTVSPA